MNAGMKINILGRSCAQLTKWNNTNIGIGAFDDGKHSIDRYVRDDGGSISMATVKKKYGSRRWIKYIFICIAAAESEYMKCTSLASKCSFSCSLCTSPFPLHKTYVALLAEQKKNWNKNEFSVALCCFYGVFFINCSRFLFVFFLFAVFFSQPHPVYSQATIVSVDFHFSKRTHCIWYIHSRSKLMLCVCAMCLYDV